MSALTRLCIGNSSELHNILNRTGSHALHVHLSRLTVFINHPIVDVHQLFENIQPVVPTSSRTQNCKC